MHREFCLEFCFLYCVSWSVFWRWRIFVLLLVLVLILGGSSLSRVEGGCACFSVCGWFDLDSWGFEGG